MDMEYRTLGRTGLEVSVVGLGSLAFIRANSTPEDVDRMIARARQGGINLLDTADAYGKGKTDAMVGAAIEQDRDRWVLISRSNKREPEAFAESMERAFRNLRTDTLDVFQLHDVTAPEVYEATRKPGSVYDIALKAKEDGRVRFLGISTHGTAEMMRDMIESGRYDVMTIAYNAMSAKSPDADGEDMRRNEDEILPLAQERGVGITIMKPFGGGSLVQERRGPDGAPVRLDPLGLLKFCVANPCVASVTPGVNTVEHVDTAIAAGQTGAGLAEEQLEELRKQAAVWGRDFCRCCGYCLPCQEGIQIPSAMQILEMFTSGAVDAARKMYADLDPKPEVCVECGECEERCPYSLPISEKLKELVEAAGA